MSKAEKPDKEYLVVEYTATNDAYMHYDNFSWQVGAVLIAGAFIFWGFLIDKNIEPVSFVAGSILVAGLMSFWMMYSNHNRQIYLCKLHRLHEIERILGFQQHRRWTVEGNNNQPLYRTFGLQGHTLDFLIYVVSSLGAPIISVVKSKEFDLWLWLPILLMIIVVLLWTSRNVHNLKAHLKRCIREEDTELTSGVGSIR